MRVVRWTLGVITVLFVVAVLGRMAWSYYIYTGDLPNIDELAQLAPKSKSMVFDPCAGHTVEAIPPSEINENVRKANWAKEGPASDSDFAMDVAVERVICTFPPPEELISRSRRLTHHLVKRFTPEQLLAIHLNSFPFVNLRTTGIESASEQAFHKPASKLELDEAAYIFATLDLERPNPGVALELRNGFLDIMVQKQLITAQEAAIAKARPGPPAQK